jgi:hypothetical protein
MGTPRDRLDRLTRRWRERHDARLGAGDRPRASGGREALARRHFPYRTETPQQYADAHGADMIGFIYDEESYADPELDAWVVELGGILRERRAAAAPTPKPKAEPKPKATPRAKAEPKPKATPKADG